MQTKEEPEVFYEFYDKPKRGSLVFQLYCTYIYIDPFIFMPSHTHIHAHTRSHARPRASTHRYAQTSTHTHTRKRTSTHRYAQTLKLYMRK